MVPGVIFDSGQPENFLQAALTEHSRDAMCLILFAYKSHPAYKLIVAANRDEYYDRSTEPAAFWPECPRLLAGRDLRAGGTWLGITTRGKLAAITNYRDPTANKSDAPSRGNLVYDFLVGQENPSDYIGRVRQKADIYNGMSLILGNKEALYCYSNRGKGIRNVTAGIYGLSNHLLDTPWPKVTRGKEMLQSLLAREKDPTPDAILEILASRSIPEDKYLPDTGVGLEWERLLSPIFVSSQTYGTRCSTIVFIDQANRVTFVEKTFGLHAEDTETTQHQFQIED